MKYNHDYPAGNSQYDAGTITFPDFPGYTARIGRDDFPSNPLNDQDGLAPLARYSEVFEGPTVNDLWGDIPEATRQERWKAFLREVIGYNHVNHFRDWLTHRRNYDNPHSALADYLGDITEPSGWGEACDYFGLMGSLAEIAGFPCVNTQSNGYCQGHSVLLFSYVSPRHSAKWGVEGTVADCQHVCDLYGSWCWGDVYGLANLVNPDGGDVEGASCCGFHGDDFVASGLVDYIAEHIRGDISSRAKERKESRAMACRGMNTV